MQVAPLPATSTTAVCAGHQAPAHEVCGRCGAFTCAQCGVETPEGRRCAACVERERVPRQGPPLLTLWIKPRLTMRWLLQQPAAPRVEHALGAAGGITLALMQMKALLPHLAYWKSALLAVGVGAVEGIALLYTLTGIVWIVGRWLGGKANWSDAWRATAWSNTYDVWALPLCHLPMIILSGSGTYGKSGDLTAGSPAALYLALGAVGLVQGILQVWGMVMSLKILAEAHRFSAWRASVIVFAWLGFLTSIYWLQRSLA